MIRGEGLVDDDAQMWTNRPKTEREQQILRCLGPTLEKLLAEDLFNSSKWCLAPACMHRAHLQDQLRRFPVQVLLETCSWVVFYFGHVFLQKTLARLTCALPTLLFLEEATTLHLQKAIYRATYTSIYNYTTGPTLFNLAVTNGNLMGPRGCYSPLRRKAKGFTLKATTFKAGPFLFVYGIYNLYSKWSKK